MAILSLKKPILITPHMVPICLANEDMAKESLITLASGFGQKTGACMTNEVGPSIFQRCTSSCQEFNLMNDNCSILFDAAIKLIPKKYENITVDMVFFENLQVSCYR